MFVSLITEAGDLFRGKPASNEAADEEGLVLFAELAEISPLKFEQSRDRAVSFQSMGAIYEFL